MNYKIKYNIHVILFDDKFWRLIPPGFVEPCFKVWQQCYCWNISREFVPQFDCSDVEGVVFYPTWPVFWVPQDKLRIVNPAGTLTLSQTDCCRGSTCCSNGVVWTLQSYLSLGDGRPVLIDSTEQASLGTQDFWNHEMHGNDTIIKFLWKLVSAKNSSFKVNLQLTCQFQDCFCGKY